MQKKVSSFDIIKAGSQAAEKIKGGIK